MPTFAYQARNKAGERVSGVRDAPDQRSALEALRELGLYVTQLTPAPGARAPQAHVPSARTPQAREYIASAPTAPVAGEGFERANDSEAERLEAAETLSEEPEAGAASARDGVPSPRLLPMEAATTEAPLPVQPLLHANSKQRALFFRQMHAMLHAGTSIAHALKTMGENAPNAALQRASLEMSLHTAKGHPWSESMRAYPGLFSELTIGMVSAGEMGGFLDRICLRLSEYSERDYEIEQTIKRETWYPKLLVFASILIPSVPPLVVAWYSGQGLPAAFAAWLQSIAPPLLLIGMVWGLWKFANYVSPVAARAGSLRYSVDFVKLIIPIGGKTVRALATAKFCRALGTLYSAGMGPHKAIALSANACGNAVIAEAARRAIPRVEHGESLTDALVASGQIRGIAAQMLRTGEESGDIDGQLDKVADFLEQDAETTVKQAVKVLSILVFILIAIRILMQLISFYTGYFDSIFSEVEKMS
jgi:type IV pilus assembly protein PilC